MRGPLKLALAVGFVVAGTPFLSAAQTQVRPRVILMIDTSGSMTEHFNNNNESGGDGSSYYQDGVMTRQLSTDANLSLYEGFELNPTNTCPAGGAEVYDGSNGRLAGAKAAVTNVVNGSGDVDWGLMRYSGTQCAVVPHTFIVDGATTPSIPLPPGKCLQDSDCPAGAAGDCNTGSNRCACTTANVATKCPAGGVNWTCGTNNNANNVDHNQCVPAGTAQCNGFSRRNSNNSGHYCRCTAGGGECGATGNGLCDTNTEVCNCDDGNGNDICAVTQTCNTTTRVCSCDVAKCTPTATCGANECHCTSSAQCDGGTCSGGLCGHFSDFVPQGCGGNGDCGNGQTCTGGQCTCGTDNDCRYIQIGGNNVVQFCVGGVCGYDTNHCVVTNNYNFTDTRNNQGCGNHSVRTGVTYNGSCGSQVDNNDTECQTTKVCYQNSDCSTNNCVLNAGGTVGECFCNNAGDCANFNTSDGNADYACTANRCVYNAGCSKLGGALLVDPSQSGYSVTQVLPWVNGREIYTVGGPAYRSGTAGTFAAGAPGGEVTLNGLVGVDPGMVNFSITISNANTGANNGTYQIAAVNSSTSVNLVNGSANAGDAHNGTIHWSISFVTDPELRAVGSTPLASAARYITDWYSAIKSYSTNPANTNCPLGTDPNPLCDPKIACRPYVLVQMTDGLDTCERTGGGGNGGDANEGPAAAASGFVDATTANARVANKVYIIGLAFAGASAPSLDALAKAGGTSPARFANSQADIQAALADIVSSSVLVEKCNYIDDDCNGIADDPFPGEGTACTNGAVGHCAANGKFECSTDQLSEVCGPSSCRFGAGSSLTKAGSAMTLSGVSGFVATDVGQQITIVAARSGANLGTFPITAQAGTSVTFTNAAGVAETIAGTAVSYTIYCTQQSTCRQGNGTTLTVAGGTNVTLTGVPGFVAADINLSITITSAGHVANVGTFPITAVNTPAANTVTFTNPAGVADAGPISYSIDCRSPSCRFGGAVNFATKTATTINVTGLSGFSASDVNAVLTIHGATNGSNNGNFVISAVNGAGTILTINNAAGVVENTGVAQWNIYCANAESLGGCNNFDDDCNGVVDDCTQGVAGSCCASSSCLPVELCNGIDDNCNNIIDDNPVDVGGTCGNSVGDCSPGTIACCTGDPTMGGSCVNAHATTDGPFCVGGNPGYPKPADLCDGTDDNCDGTPNGVPPNPCYIDPTATMNPFNPALAGVGLCRAGSQPCTTAPLPYGSPLCPTPWPSPSPCPNPAHTFGACTGAAGPHAEVCNGEDDDCDGTKDNNVTDPWVGTACCPTGNLADCTNSGGGSRCSMGTYQCVMGGEECVGGVAKSPEICDGIDNDCNGVTDDVPGLNSTCTANGANNQGSCKAVFICVVGTPGMCDGMPCPNGLTCDQIGTPGVEVCNGVDDDCDGIVDNPNEVMMNDPALMMPCDVPAPPNDKPPCMAGTPVCLNGKVECTGAVTPMTNVCGEAATDCTGNPSNNCPPGSMCFQGNCVTPCGNGEFPCQGGFVCDQTQTPPLCIPNACAQKSCPTGQNCQVGSDGSATCVDPCAGINCGMGFACLDGACVDNSCRTFGCPADQLCTGTPPACIPNPCFGVECDAGDYCSNGTCFPLCTTCLKGESCVDGMCQGDPCAAMKCPNGQVCADTSGVASCVSNMCAGSTCGLDQVCCGGGCVSDPCDLVVCPAGINCEIDDDCKAKCSSAPQAPADKIVGAGGGGFDLGDMGGGHGGEGALWMVLLLVAALVTRRRRSIRSVGAAGDSGEVR